MKPIASATAYAALATRTPVLVTVAWIATGTGLGTIMIQEFIYPDMVQAIDQINNFALEVIAPKQIRPFTGYIYDAAADAAR